MCSNLSFNFNYMASSSLGLSSYKQGLPREGRSSIIQEEIADCFDRPLEVDSNIASITNIANWGCKSVAEIEDPYDTTAQAPCIVNSFDSSSVGTPVWGEKVNYER